MPESNYPPRPGRLMNGGGAKDADLPTYPPTPDKLTTPPSPSGGGPGSGSSVSTGGLLSRRTPI